MTVAQLLNNTTSEELAEWQAYFMVKNREAEEERDSSTKNAEAEARAKKQGRGD